MIRDWLLSEIIRHKKALKTNPDDEARLIYTNVRGVIETEHVLVFSNEHIIPAIFKAPVGTLFLIDEIGQVADKFDLKKDVFSSDLTSDENGVTEVINTFPVLMDKQRHFNFDFVFTAPSIKRVPDLIRNIAEFGYKHKNLSSLGLKGFYIQGQHIGESTGAADSNFLKKTIKKMPKEVFKLYHSTTTGKFNVSPVKDAKLYKHPAVIMLVFILAISFYALYNLDIVPESEEKTEPNTTTVKTSFATKEEALAATIGKVDPNAYLLEQNLNVVSIHGSYRPYYIVGTCDKQTTIISSGLINDKGLHYNNRVIPHFKGECPKPIEDSIEDHVFSGGMDTVDKGVEFMGQTIN
jgi:zona occludens toxin (predicted ATPase)